MPFSSDGLLGLLSSKMGYLSQKQSLHAQNVAHSNTPNYKARELEPFSFGDAMKKARMKMELTDSRHILPPSMAGVNAATVKVKNYDASPDGNTVDVEQELMKVSETGMNYQLATSLYRKVTGLFKIALKGNAG